ncbi:acyltransferase family protein [Variovorax boronicumulans]|uniref:acyltransferase family protein n=1 Tax=Variovorax boronicumulans TaxID=436515 RepID=UPI001C5962B3
MTLGLGSWRFLLAFLVVISHLWGGMIHGPAAYAVWGFFVLSGFLMTHVLRHKYGDSAAGLRDFAFNRILRIFPAYWISCILGGIAILILPKIGVALSTLNPQFAWPQGLVGWFGNITLLPLPVGNLLVPVSGALAVEVGAYMLMPLMAFNRPAAWLGLILSLLLNAVHGFQPDTFALRYSSFLTAFWVFAFGALISHYQGHLRRLEAPRLSVIFWLANSLVWLWNDAWPWTYGLYCSVLLSAWVVLSLATRRPGRVDGFLGDLSYPIYLFHTVAGAFVWLVVPQERSLLFLALSFGVTLAVSWLVVVFVDRRIDGLKKRKVFKDLAATPSGLTADTSVAGAHAGAAINK